HGTLHFHRGHPLAVILGLVPRTPCRMGHRRVWRPTSTAATPRRHPRACPEDPVQDGAPREVAPSTRMVANCREVPGTSPGMTCAGPACGDRFLHRYCAKAEYSANRWDDRDAACHQGDMS